MRNRQQSCRNKSTDKEEGDPRCLLCSYEDDFIACFSCPLRRLYCLFLISITTIVACFSCPLRLLYCLFLIFITATVAALSSPLDLTFSTKPAFWEVKGWSQIKFSPILWCPGRWHQSINTKLRTASRTTPRTKLITKSSATLKQPQYSGLWPHRN